MAKQLPTTNRRNLLAGLAAAPVAGLPAFADTTGPDAELLRLGRELDSAWGALNSIEGSPDDIFAVAYDRTQAIIKQIIPLKAQTFDGLKVKARALSCCHCGNFEGIAESVGNVRWDDGKFVKDAPTTDRIVADSILHDLIALAAKS